MIERYIKCNMHFHDLIWQQKVLQMRKNSNKKCKGRSGGRRRLWGDREEGRTRNEGRRRAINTRRDRDNERDERKSGGSERDLVGNREKTKKICEKEAFERWIKKMK